MRTSTSPGPGSRTVRSSTSSAFWPSNSRAGLDALGDQCLDPVALAGRDERADDRRGQQRIPDGAEPGVADELLDQLVVDRAVNQGPGRGRTDLAGVEGPGVADPGGRPVEVGVLEHDRRALAAELHELALHVPAGGRADPAADGGAPGEADHVDIGRGHQCGAGVHPGPGDDVHHPGRNPRLVDDLGEPQHLQRVLRGGLTRRTSRRPSPSAATSTTTSW
jgi:hypothetical protein